MKKLLSSVGIGLAMASTTMASPDSDSISTMMQYSDELNQLVYIVLNDSIQSNRLAAHNDLNKKLEEALKNKESLNYDFTTNLKGISVQEPADKAFRIFTWQLFVNDSTYQYGGYIQLKNGDVFKLDDKANEHKQAWTLRLKHTNWYGALYYKMLPFQHDGKDMYLLFGYNAHDFFTRRKLLDVLFFENGKPKFGYPVIESRDSKGRERTVQRFIMEYSSSVMVTLNYSEADGMVVYDHLVSGAPIEEGGATNVPDGSYCGFKLEKGRWTYVDKIHNDEVNPETTWNNPTAPMEKPLFDDKKNQKDIFGRKKRN